MMLLRLLAASKVIVVATAVTTVPATPDLQVAFERSANADQDLHYEVFLDGSLWLSSSPLRIFAEGAWQAVRPDPAAPAPTNHSGSDAIGRFSATTIAWRAGKTPVHTTVRRYMSADPPALVFALAYPDGANETNSASTVGTAAHSATFPAFALTGKLPSLGYRSWSGNMCADDASTIPLNVSQMVNSAAANSIANGPAALYEAHDGPCLFISPHSNFMTEQHNLSATSGLSFGPGGELGRLPPGFTQETIVVAGNGISATVLAWGKHARATHNPVDQPDKIADITLRELGYWTDNGAYYYFYGRPPTRKYEPEAILRRVMQRYRELAIPIKYVQLDAWWYKTHECKQGYACACIQDFAPDYAPFNYSGDAPSGPGPYFNTTLKSLGEELGVQWDLYQNYFCPPRNGTMNRWQASGKFDFVVDSYGQQHPGLGFAHVLPDQSQDFFLDVWGQGVGQGMIAAEWDYQSTAYSDMAHYRSNVTAASDYVAGMANAALEYGIALQFCMSFPRFLLESMKHPAVTNARGSEDYAGGYDNLLKVGYTSLFYEAVGVATSKDNFWTTHPGTGPDGASTDQTEVIVALLSKGPVGPSDGLAWLGNRSAWIMATCNADGALLQPSTPIRTIDAKFSLNPDGHAVPMGAEVWAASSTVSGQNLSYTTHILFALDLPEAGFKLWRNDTEPKMHESVEYVYRSHGAPGCTSEPKRHRETVPLPPTCKVQVDRDMAGGESAVAYAGHPATISNTTQTNCCIECGANPSCTAWIFGPLNGVPTCFLAREVRGTRASSGRNFSCMADNKMEVSAPPCVLRVPVAGIPLSTTSPGDRNCSAPAPDSTGNSGHALVTVYPVFNGIALLGELDKWVNVSPNRFANLTINSAGLSVDLHGAVGEMVSVTVLVDDLVVVRKVWIGADNTAALLVKRSEVLKSWPQG